jgi:thiamine biosynthesis protein ThiI
VLLSGGIDSPVAAFYAMKRGLFPIYAHVHMHPDEKEIESSKISGILKILSRYSGTAKVHYLPGYLFQSYIANSRTRFELVLFKRFILKLAEYVAAKEGAEAIVTGDSLGQVASQTASNMTSASAGTNVLIVCPLVCFDKSEITEEAKRLGTYELSIQPYKDVCSLSAKNPRTRSAPEIIEKEFKELHLDDAVKETIKREIIKTYAP